MRLWAHPIPYERLLEFFFMPVSGPPYLPDWIHLQGNLAGPPVVLVSGLGGSGSFWSAVTPYFLKQFLVVTYDQPGCGKRIGIPEPTTIDNLADDLASVCKTCFGAQPVTVIGHSTGGTIAQTFAARHPTLTDKLVLSGTWLQSDAYMRELFTFRRNLLHRAPELAAGLTALLTEETMEIAEGSLALKPIKAAQVALISSRIDALLEFDGTAIRSQISARSLIIGAKDDRVIPLDRQVELHNTLTGSSLRIIEEGGHFFPKTQPETFTRFVHEWI